MHRELKLGSVIEGDEERDAIHVAVVPVVAAETLFPGQHVGLGPDGKLVGEAWKHIGIIDPFLKEHVTEGTKVWLFLYPNTVTDMRHHWSHPAFETRVTEPVVSADDAKQASWDWMRDYARKHYSHKDEYYDGFGGLYTAEMVIEHATDYLKTGHKHVQQGSESLRDSFWKEGGAVGPEFWRHFEVITGIKPAEYLEDMIPFCCTC